MPYAEPGDPQTLNLDAYGRNSPVPAVDADGHTPLDWIWEQTGHLQQEVGFGFHLWDGAAEGKSGNCSDPCVVRASGGQVSPVDAAAAQVEVQMYLTEWAWRQFVQGIFSAPSLWFRGSVNFFLNGRLGGAGQMGLALASVLPDGEGLGVVSGELGISRNTLKHLAPHLAEFRELDSSIGLREMVDIGQEVLSSGTEVRSRTRQMYMEIGGRRVLVRAAEKMTGGLRTVFIVK